MNRFKKILVYANTLAKTNPAIQRAIQLAQHNNAELKIVDVQKNDSGSYGEMHRAMRSLVEQERLDRLNSICEPLRDQNIDYSIELLRGRPFVEVVREVIRHGFHLVLKTSGGERKPGTLSALDMRLVRNCPCPILLEQSDSCIEVKRVVVALDPQSGERRLNHTLLRIGKSLTEFQNGELHVVSAWKVPDERFLEEKMESKTYAQYYDDVHSIARDNLDSLLADAKVVDTDQVHFIKGEAPLVIVDCLERLGPDILVIGTVTQTEIPGFLIGNTAETVLRQIKCSVLAVKPDGIFRT